MFDLRKCENQKNQKLLVFNINLYRKSQLAINYS